MPRILHIENDPNCLELSRIILERQGFEFLSAATIDFGLLQTEKSRPDLIILSAKYASHNGAEIANLLLDHPQAQHVPIVFFCSAEAYRDLAAQVTQKNSPAIHHIEQPTTYQKFLEGVTLALDRKKAERAS